MILKNKKALISASLLTLLPLPIGLALWDSFPQEAAPGFLVIATPLIMLAVQWLCILLTSKDPGNQGRNKKPLGMVLWIIPFLSCLCNGIMYALFLGAEFSPSAWMMGGMGLMFAIIGNYLPKTKMNSTVGIKVPWAYTSEENWNATHRFAGKIWVIGGIVIALVAFLPEAWAFAVMLIGIIVLCVVPVWYSYRYYKKELAEGKPLKAGYGPVDKKVLKISDVFLAVLLVFVAVVMFTGDLNYQFGADSFTIEASFYGDLTVSYDDIDAVEYREGNVPGYRAGGFASFRLLMGFFENDEFGIYTRYTFYKPESCIVVTMGEKTLVLSGETAAETTRLYNTLLEKIS